MIAEEMLNLEADEDHANLLSSKKEKLRETVNQLVFFIIKTCYSDVAWRNNPFLKDKKGLNGDRKIGLVDLDSIHFNSKLSLLSDIERIIQIPNPLFLESPGILHLIEDAGPMGEDVLLEAKKYLFLSERHNTAAQT